MSNSPLVSYTLISPNRTILNNKVNDTISIHCVVGQTTMRTLGSIFAPTSRKASSNYGVCIDGIGMYCEEKDRSWCTSSSTNDSRAITIEVASDTFHPYKIKDSVYNDLIDLLVDICKRNPKLNNGLRWRADKNLIGQVDKQNMTVHRWFAAKACPGDYLYDLHYKIAEDVNSRLKSVTPKPIPVPSPIDEISVGDIVIFEGGPIYTSSVATKPAHSRNKSEVKITAIAKKSKHPYHAISQDGKGVYGWVDSDLIESNFPPPFKDYLVRVTASVLNIRTGPGVNYSINGTIKDKGVYTIVEESNGWGKLKSKMGWISLQYTKKL